MNKAFIAYLLVGAGVTYLIRMLPLVLIRKKIENRFVLSFLYYMPYAVLTVMTIPACFLATSELLPAVIGFAAAFILAIRGKSLLVVAVCMAAVVCVCEYAVLLI